MVSDFQSKTDKSDLAAAGTQTSILNSQSTLSVMLFFFPLGGSLTSAVELSGFPGAGT